MLEKIIKNLALQLFLAVFAWQVFAFSIHSLDQKDINFNQDTMVFLLGGDSDDQGIQFLMTAISRARQYESHFPDRQFLIFTANSNPKMKAMNHSFLKKNQYFLKADLEFPLSMGKFITWLRQFAPAKIKSLDIIWHGNPLTGQAMQAGSLPQDDHFNAKHPQIKELKSLLSEDAYLILQGCNTGWITAPELSRTLDRPVAGSFTGTQFYHKDTTSNSFNNQQKTTVNTDRCQSSACTRMLPQPTTYAGWAGEFREAGVGFFKFFCNFENQSASQYKKCLKAMALSLYGFPSAYHQNAFTNETYFRQLVADFICGNHPQAKKESCIKTLAAADIAKPMPFTPFSGETLKCDFNRCYADIQCEVKSDNPNAFQPGSCRIKKNQNYITDQQTYWNEFVAYLYGYSLLQNEM